MKLVATVFEVEPENVAAFRAAVFTGAREMERRDPACRGVAIAEDPEAPGFFLTSALYADAAAAEGRDDSAAARAFEEAVRPYIKLRRVRLFDLG
ncbi:antibiotic biosynthesis monooxygenase [Methylopila henanensis]|uniref:Antibiotic biosynthesis monooxygenase n=1 Tax=Methylopila henanensis TaxID=873516 RepID=A0ABW4KC35_9HYPH